MTEELAAIVTPLEKELGEGPAAWQGMGVTYREQQGSLSHKQRHVLITDHISQK